MTLVELAVTLGLVGLVGALVAGILLRQNRHYRTQTDRIETQQQLRAAIGVLPPDLRELDATDGDIEWMTPTGLEIRAMRWIGFLCGPASFDARSDQVSLTLARTPFFGLRDIDPADSLLLYFERIAAQRDVWWPAKARSVSSAACSNGAAGLQLTAVLRPGRPANPDGIAVGAPVRGFERARYRAYQSAADRQWYLGVQSPGSAIEPIAGPFVEDGFHLAYIDATGRNTTDSRRVARIDIAVRAPHDSSSMSVALRNNRRN